MKNWVYECKGFKKVRDLIKSEIETPQNCIAVLFGIQYCCNELIALKKKDWSWQDSFEDLKSEIQEDLSLVDTDKYEDCEYFANYYLNEFYDLCDSAGVWLSI